MTNEAKDQGSAQSAAGAEKRTTGPFARALTWGLVVVVAAGVGALIWALGFNTTQRASVTTTTTLTAAEICALDQSKTYIQVTALAINGDGSATVTSHPVTLHCGGPDDRQYEPGVSTEQITLVANAALTILDQAQNYAPTPATLSQLQSYLAADSDGNIFLVTGPLTAATALTAVFHP